MVIECLTMNEFYWYGSLYSGWWRLRMFFV